MRTTVLLAGLAVWICAFAFAASLPNQNASLGVGASVAASPPLTEQQLRVMAQNEAQRFVRLGIHGREQILRDFERRYTQVSPEFHARLADLVLAELSRNSYFMKTSD